MTRARMLYAVIALALLALAGFGVWMASLPGTPSALTATPVPQAEVDALLTTLEPRRARPVIAVPGLNAGTETTDYLLPASILRRADVAEVRLLAAAPGPVQLYPALRVQPDATFAGFDAAYPGGADYVIVPAMRVDDDPAILDWLRQQARKGATIIGVCAGAKVVAAAGLLNGRRATTHWYYLDTLLSRSPTIQYVPDRRMVADRGVVTTTGITASVPTALAMVQAIAGSGRADALARELGVLPWDARHASGAFQLTRPFATTVLKNRLSLWRRESLGLRLTPGMDELALAFAADIWSRTYLSRVQSYAKTTDPVPTRGGIRVIPDLAAPDWPQQSRITLPKGPPLQALDRALEAVLARYDKATADIVAMQLEYPRWDSDLLSR